MQVIYALTSKQKGPFFKLCLKYIKCPFIKGICIYFYIDKFLNTYFFILYLNCKIVSGLVGNISDLADLTKLHFGPCLSPNGPFLPHTCGFSFTLPIQAQEKMNRIESVFQVLGSHKKLKTRPHSPCGL